MGLYRRQLSGVGCTVCLWLLQRDADVYAAWLGGDGAVQAENLVHLLPDGDDDADDLQDEAVEGLAAGPRRACRQFQTSQRRGRCAEYYIIIIRKYIDF